MASRRDALVDHLGLHQRIADVDALREQERERHRSADQHLVAPVEQRIDHAELVAHLGAAEHGDERARHVVGEQPRQHLDLAVQEPTARVRQDRRRADDRRVRPVRRPERLVDVDDRRAPRGWWQNAGSSAVSPGSKRRFSSMHDIAGTRRRDQRLDARARPPPAPAARRTRGARSTAAATGAIEYCGSTTPFGRPRWPATTTTAWRSRSHWIVGSAVVMRRSSSTTPSRNGTLRSTRTRTRCPFFRGRSSRRGSSTIPRRRRRGR